MDLFQFEEKIGAIDWESELGNLPDVDDMCEKFTNLFLEIARACIPTKTVTIRNNDKPWFNSELRKEIRIRDRLKKKGNIKDLHFHDLRHEAISRFFEKGLSIPEVALISGHKDVRMLFRYTHLKAEDVISKLNVSTNL